MIKQLSNEIKFGALMVLISFILLLLSPIIWLAFMVSCLLGLGVYFLVRTIRENNFD